MVVVPPEGALGGVAAAGGTSVALADVSPAEGDTRDRPVTLGEESTDAVPTPVHEEAAPRP